MKYMNAGQQWLNLSLLNLSFFRIVYLILSILANFLASKFSDLFNFINFTFPIFTQFVYFYQLFELEICMTVCQIMGNYGLSKSLILTAFKKWCFIHFPLLENYTTLRSLLKGNFEKLFKSAQTTPGINFYRISKIQVKQISKSFVKTFLQIRKWSNG